MITKKIKKELREYQKQVAEFALAYLKSSNSKTIVTDKINEETYEIEGKRSFTFQSPTGSGKTLITLNIMNEIANSQYFSEKDYTFLFIAPSEADLAGQAQKAYSREVNDNTLENCQLKISSKLNDLTFSSSMLKNNVYFLGWSSADKDKNQLMKQLGIEFDKSIFDCILDNTFIKNKTELIIFIDEQHLRSTNDKNLKASQLYHKILETHKNVFGYNPLVVDFSATAKVQNGVDYIVKYKDVVDAGLLKENIEVKSEESTINQNNVNDNWKLLVADSVDKINEIKSKSKFYKDKKINPLCLIQLENKHQDKIVIEHAEVTEVLNKIKGVSLNKIAVWMSDDKIFANNEPITKEQIAANNSPIEYVIFKTALTTGWDVPRACVLTKLRKIGKVDESKERNFIQLLGRVLRNPFHTKTGIELSDSAYIFVYHNEKEAIEKIVNNLKNDYEVEKESYQIKETTKSDNLVLNKVFIYQKEEDLNWEQFFSEVDKKIHAKESEILKEIEQVVSDSWEAFINKKGEKFSFKTHELDNGEAIKRVYDPENVSKWTYDVKQGTIFDAEYFVNPVTLRQWYINFVNSFNNKFIKKYTEYWINKIAIKKSIENKEDDFIKKAYKFFAINGLFTNRAMYWDNRILETVYFLTKQNEVKELLEYKIPATIKIDKTGVNEDKNENNDYDKINSHKVSINTNLKAKEVVKTIRKDKVEIVSSKSIFKSELEREIYNTLNNLSKFNKFIYLFQNDLTLKESFFVSYTNSLGKISYFYPDFILANDETIMIFDCKGMNFEKELQFDQSAISKLNALFEHKDEIRANSNRKILFGLVYKDKNNNVLITKQQKQTKNLEFERFWDVIKNNFI